MGNIPVMQDEEETLGESMRKQKMIESVFIQEIQAF